jgi:Flp pilus assembly pilin Flp
MPNLEVKPSRGAVPGFLRPGFLRKMRRDQRGASAVEFALTAPILFLVISGTLDMAQGYYVNTVLQGSLNAAGRNSSLQSAGTEAATLDAAVSKMIKYAMPKASVTFTRKSYSQFSSVGKPEDFTDTIDNDTYDPSECFVDMNGNETWDADMGSTGLGGANDVQVYKVSVSYKPMFGFGSYLGLPTNQKIQGTTILRNQPYSTQSMRTGVSICP